MSNRKPLGRPLKIVLMDLTIAGVAMLLVLAVLALFVATKGDVKW